jgi:hypothetical protein
MSPGSIHVGPSASLSRFCCAFSVRNAAMTSAGIGSVRRERSDFGAPVVVPAPRTTTRPWATLTVPASKSTARPHQAQHFSRTKKEILRLLKRAIAREIVRLLTQRAPIDNYCDLRPARQAKNITLATVATHFGVPLITVSRLERGHQRNDTLANNYRQWLTAA